MAEGQTAGEPAAARRGGWRRLLAWLIEYNRY
jgi:hypothetical protein